MIGIVRGDAMSNANTALCRRFYDEVWNGRSLAAIAALVAPDYVSHDPNSPDFGRGPDACRAEIGYYLAAFPDLRIGIEEIVAEADRVAVRWVARGTQRGKLGSIAPTGRAVTVTGTTIWRIADGRLASSHTNFDALGLFQQLGILQRPAAEGATA
jgi:steroid delta-isomerase-like uncharacterized protein